MLSRFAATEHSYGMLKIKKLRKNFAEFFNFSLKTKTFIFAIFKNISRREAA